ncbi:MAG: hypothetical protein PUC05_07460 [Firmicutes bacterium]|nr:hypothetical protein [Bacillota bacterium]
MKKRTVLELSAVILVSAVLMVLSVMGAAYILPKGDITVNLTSEPHRDAELSYCERSGMFFRASRSGSKLHRNPESGGFHASYEQAQNAASGITQMLLGQYPVIDNTKKYEKNTYEKTANTSAAYTQAPDFEDCYLEFATYNHYNGAVMDIWISVCDDYRRRGLSVYTAMDGSTLEPYYIITTSYFIFEPDSYPESAAWGLHAFAAALGIDDAGLKDEPGLRERLAASPKLLPSPAGDWPVKACIISACLSFEEGGGKVYIIKYTYPETGSEIIFSVNDSALEWALKD